ncbi:MAG: hypothetical protein QOI83_3200, partial [Streptomycetaceae bacterium]|nr:hypothetical protein [Streptomycetaceae bacterium]
ARCAHPPPRPSLTCSSAMPGTRWRSRSASTCARSAAAKWCTTMSTGSDRHARRRSPPASDARVAVRTFSSNRIRATARWSNGLTANAEPSRAGAAPIRPCSGAGSRACRRRSRRRWRKHASRPPRRSRPPCRPGGPSPRRRGPGSPTPSPPAPRRRMQQRAARQDAHLAQAERHRRELREACSSLLTALTDHRRHQYLKLRLVGTPPGLSPKSHPYGGLGRAGAEGGGMVAANSRAHSGGGRWWSSAGSAGGAVAPDSVGAGEGASPAPGGTGQWRPPTVRCWTSMAPLSEAGPTRAGLP